MAGGTILKMATTSTEPTTNAVAERTIHTRIERNIIGSNLSDR